MSMKKLYVYFPKDGQRIQVLRVRDAEKFAIENDYPQFQITDWKKNVGFTPPRRYMLIGDKDGYNKKAVLVDFIPTTRICNCEDDNSKCDWLISKKPDAFGWWSFLVCNVCDMVMNTHMEKTREELISYLHAHRS